MLSQSVSLAVCRRPVPLWAGVRLGALLLVLIGLALIKPVFAAEAALRATQPVGDVTLVIGNVQVQRGEQMLAVTRGTALQVGDSIQTQTNGHAHIRFVDGALVSVRPSSTMRIVEYQFDAANPAASVVRFQLDQGVVRAISGRAAEAAKDKFRLNTPLAAIGVRGTDFVVESTQNRVNAVVNQGTIVLAPFDAQCRADALGPCASQAARELTAALRGMALTYSGSMASPQLLPMGQLKGSGLPSAIQTPLSEQNESSKSQQTQVDSKGAARADQIVRSFVSNPDTLVWGRWGSVRDQDSLTIAFRSALEGRAVTVGDGYYFLFRREEGVANLLSLDQGSVNFGLQASHATFQDASNDQRQAAVAVGTLGINFSTREFNTNLKLQSSSAADQTLQASGKLDAASGIFISTNNPQTGRVAGALSLDTRQAGYFFNLPVGNGSYRGATLWGR